MTEAVVVAPCAPLAIDGRSRRLMGVVRGLARRSIRFRLRCLILGHEDGFARQPHRLMLRCAACGRETTGWAIGPGAPTAVVATSAPRHASPFSRLTAVSPGLRVRPWGRGPWRARADARDRQRLRMVLAATRAAEPRSDHGSAPASPVKPQVRWVPSPNASRDDWLQRQKAIGRRSTM